MSLPYCGKWLKLCLTKSSVSFLVCLPQGALDYVLKSLIVSLVHTTCPSGKKLIKTFTVISLPQASTKSPFIHSFIPFSGLKS